MNVAIELHDSECLAVEVDESGRGFVLLDAYVHRSEGEPGVAPGEGGVQRIRINLGAMSVEGDLGDLPAYIYQGSLTVGTLIKNNMVSIPADYSGPASLRLMLSDDARIVTISGAGISIKPEGEFRFVETVDFTGRK
jgi:hypothetical protein